MPRLTLPTVLLLAALALPSVAHAARKAAASHGTSWVMLPFLLAVAMGAQVLLARATKAVAASAAPLATGEVEIGGYARSVYGSPDGAMQGVVALGLLSGVLLWVGVAWGYGLVGFLGFLLLLGSVALDLMRWDRVTVSAHHVWFQRGFGQKVHQVAIENIRDVTVTESDAPGLSLRRLNRNRRCRLTLRLNNKQVVALPKADAYVDLDDVEAVANQIRTSQQLADDRAAAKRSAAAPTTAASSPPIAPKVSASVVPLPPKLDRELMRELKRLRQSAQAQNDAQANGAQPANKA